MSQPQKDRRRQLVNQQLMSDAELFLVPQDELGVMFQDKVIALNHLLMADPTTLTEERQRDRAKLKNAVDALNVGLAKNPVLAARAETLSNADLKQRLKALKRNNGSYPGHHGYDDVYLRKALPAKLAAHELTRRLLLQSARGVVVPREDSFVYTGGKNDFELRLSTRGHTPEQTARRRILCDLPEFKIHLAKAPRPPRRGNSDPSDPDEPDWQSMDLDVYLDRYHKFGTTTLHGYTEREIATAPAKDLENDELVQKRSLLRSRASDAKYRKANATLQWRQRRSAQRNEQRQRKL